LNTVTVPVVFSSSASFSFNQPSLDASALVSIVPHVALPFVLTGSLVLVASAGVAKTVPSA
jgi:hypothetical protein